MEILPSNTVISEQKAHSTAASTYKNTLVVQKSVIRLLTQFNFAGCHLKK